MNRRYGWSLAAVAAAGLLLRLAYIVVFDFDGLYGQDPYAHLAQLAAMRDWLVGAGPLPSGLFWPLGFALTALPLTLPLGATARAGQLVCLLSGVGVIALTGLIGRRIADGGGALVGVLAAAAVTVAAQPITSSVVVMSDMPSLMWAALASWLLLRASDEPEKGLWWLTGAGAALGMAVITRWIYGLLVPVFVGWVAVEIFRGRRPWWHAMAPTVAGLTIVLPQAMLGLARPEGFVGHWMIRWDLANAFRRQFTAAEGSTVFALPNWLFYTQVAGSPRYLFPLLGAFIPWGLWRLACDRDWRPLWLLLGWSGGVYIFLIGLPHQNFRYALAMYLPVVVLSSLGAVDLCRRRVTARVAVTAVGLSLAAMLAWNGPSTSVFLRDMNATKSLARSVAGALPADATLMSLGLTHTLQYSTSVDTVEFFNETPESMATRLSADAPLFLLIVLPEVRQRWRDRSPGRNLAWLERHSVLTEVTDFSPYTLIRVGPEG